MWIIDKVYQYLALAGICLVLLFGLVGYDHLSYDRTHFAQQIEESIHEQETEAVHQLREGDWISQIRSMQKVNRILSNDLVAKIEKLSHQPFTVYLYHKDSLLFWSKPGLVIDPSFKEFRDIPCVIPDHRQDYYVKKTEISDGQEDRKSVV